MSDVLEKGWYLKCTTDLDGPGLLWLGPYPNKKDAEHASDSLVNSREGERTLLAFKVERLTVVDRTEG